MNWESYRYVISRGQGMYHVLRYLKSSELEILEIEECLGGSTDYQTCVEMVHQDVIKPRQLQEKM